ncbi:kinase [Thraustotheca clavata]|uniref:Kinase n=1 Tax=Thraustotheca clavata TaxID=74557 RepID=A0A1W0A3P4_9STRA|nr:kinase [Thraustotheca clavata]
MVAMADISTPKPKIVLDYMDCGNLRSYLDAKRDNQPTPVNFNTREVAWVMANALADLHHNGYIHRDIKSDNVLLSTKNYIKLADLGYARSISSVSSSNPRGSLFWMAPEVIRGEAHNMAADIYSFGVILTELATLQVPYWDSKVNSFGLLQSISTGESKPSLGPNCEPWLGELAKKCLNFEQRNRPSILSVVQTYQLNDRGLKNLPRVENDVWNRGVRMQKPMDGPYNLVKTALKIAQAMKEFSESGLLHRNLSSKTIFMVPNDGFVIGGLFASREYDNVVTQNVMSSLWTAPEILAGSRNYDFDCDVYSFGVILTELETLQPPFNNQVDDDIIRKVVNDDLKPSLSGSCPEWYEDLVDQCLSRIIKERPSFKQIQVAKMVPGRTPIQCYQRVKRTLQPGMVKGHWTQQEDKQLIKIMSTITGDINWQNIAEMMKSRTSMQCRMRWMNHLNPAINRHPFKSEEDLVLLNEYDKQPQQWRLIAQALPKALGKAADNGDVAIVSMLLTAGAQPDFKDKEGETPLHKAAFNGHVKVIEVLLAAGASVDIKDKLSMVTAKLLPFSLQMVQKYKIRVQSPQIIPLLAYVAESPIKVVLPNITQDNLREHLDKQRTVNSVFSHRFHVAYHSAKALEDLHEKHVVHHDLTSRSIVRWKDSWKLKLSYFGQNKEVNAHLTVASVDSMLWSAPEVITSNKYTYASDIYSFGIILSELDTWKFPYEGSQLNGFGLMLAIPKGEARVDLRENCEPWYRDLVLRCLNENPSLRPNAYELVQVFANALKDAYILKIYPFHRIHSLCPSPYIIKLLAIADEPTPSPKLILEFMDGGNLRNYLDAKLKTEHTTLNFTPFEIAWVIANALSDLHQKNIVHCDLKSENIFLCSKNYIKLADVGFARLASTVSSSSPRGLLFWMAPEVIARGQHSFAADVYSFGVILTELDTLEVPYWDSKVRSWELLQSISTGESRPSLSSNCDKWYKDLAEKCLAFNPDERPTAGEIVDCFQKRLIHDDKYDNDDVNMDE